MGGNKGVRHSGTAPAYIEYTSSRASSSTSTWGGKRNSATRTSEFLTEKQARKLLVAAQTAYSNGLPLNRHLTINWEKAGIPDDRAARATGRFLKLARDWARTRGAELAHIWVRENPPHKGTHVHILLHIPAGLSLGPMQRRWIRNITGLPYRRGTLRTKRIAGFSAAPEAVPHLYLFHLSQVIIYLLKGIGPKRANGVRVCYPKHQGLVVGKRAAISQNLRSVTGAKE